MRRQQPQAAMAARLARLIAEHTDIALGSTDDLSREYTRAHARRRAQKMLLCVFCSNAATDYDKIVRRIDSARMARFFKARADGFGTPAPMNPPPKIWPKAQPAEALKNLKQSVRSYLDAKGNVPRSTIKHLCPVLEFIFMNNMLSCETITPDEFQYLDGTSIDYKDDLYVKTRVNFVTQTPNKNEMETYAKRTDTQYAAIKDAITFNRITKEWQDFVDGVRVASHGWQHLLPDFYKDVADIFSNDDMVGDRDRQYKKALARFKGNGFNLLAMNADGVTTTQCAVKNAAFQTLFGFSQGLLDRKSMQLKKRFSQHETYTSSHSGCPALYHICRFIDCAIARRGGKDTEYESAFPLQPPASAVLRGKPIVDRIMWALDQLYDPLMTNELYGKHIHSYLISDKYYLEQCRQWEETFCDKYTDAKEELMLNTACKYDLCAGYATVQAKDPAALPLREYLAEDGKTTIVKLQQQFQYETYALGPTLANNATFWTAPANYPLEDGTLPQEKALIANNVKVFSILNSITTVHSYDDLKDALRERLLLLMAAKQSFPPTKCLYDLREKFFALVEFDAATIVDKWVACLRPMNGEQGAMYTIEATMLLSADFVTKLIRLHHTHVFAPTSEDALMLSLYFKLQPADYYRSDTIRYDELRDRRFMNECIYLQEPADASVP